MNSIAAQRQALEAKRGSPDRHGNRDSLMPTLLLLHCSAPNQRASDTRRATYDKNATRNEGLVARRAAHADANSFAPCRPPCLALAARARARPLPVRACVHRASIIKSAALISALGWFTLRATARGAWTARVAQPAVPSRAGYCVIWAVSYAHRSATGTTPRGAARAARSSAHALRSAAARWRVCSAKAQSGSRPYRAAGGIGASPEPCVAPSSDGACSASAAARARARRFGSIG